MSQGQIKLSCRDLWKVFGIGEDRLDLSQPDSVEVRQRLQKLGAIAAVRDVAIDVHVGEIVVIMGLSGSGKSTLVRLMSRLIEPTYGSVLLDEQDLLTTSEKDLVEIRRHKMGMVFQHFALLPHLDVLSNVAFPLEVQGIAKAEREDRALQVIELVGLMERVDYFPRELSGGQQQRVGIARSLVVEPELWFLDEPFSALDPLIRREMQDEFLRLQSMLHKTIIFITHDFDEVIRLADRVAIMKDGELVQVGTPEQLVVSPATDYVRAFTQHVSRAKILTAKTIMRQSSNGASVVGEIRESDKVADVADRVEASNGSFAVVDENGKRVGVVDRQSVIDVLVGRQ